MPPHRVLGPHDRRLQSHRCQSCRCARTKCDGARPCSNCRTRRVQCNDAAAVAAVHTLVFLHYLPEASSHFSNDENASIEAFFAFVGPEPHSPVSAHFAPAAICHHLSCPGPVRAVVVAIGALVSFKQGKPGAPYTDNFRNTRRGLYAMLHSAPTDYSTHLLFGLLFSIFEMLFEPTGFGFSSVMDTISNQIDFYCTHVDDNHLLVLYNWFNAIRALDTNDDPRPVPACPPPEASSAEEASFHHLAAFTSALASCNARARRWLSAVNGPPPTCPQCHSPNPSRDPATLILSHPCGLHRRTGASILTSALAALSPLHRFSAAVARGGAEGVEREIVVVMFWLMERRMVAGRCSSGETWARLSADF